MFFTLKTPETISEIFDDEVIALSLLTGNYYSLTGAAKYLWPWLTVGADEAQMLAYVADAFPTVARGALVTDLQRFLAALVAEVLVVASESGSPNGPPTLRHVTEPYLPPGYESYGDMQDLLLLDPVHEVDETGWPKAADSIVSHAPTSL